MADYAERQREAVYQTYLTDALRMLTQNTSRSGGIYIKRRYADVISPHKEDTRTGEEIIEHMKATLGRLGG